MNDKTPIWFTEHFGHVAPELADSTLFKFKISLRVADGINPETNKPQKKEIEIDLLTSLNIDYESLEETMARLPSEYAYYAIIYSELRMSVSIAERNLKRRYGEVYEKIHVEYADQKLKPTAEVIKRIIEKDALIIEADMKFIKLQMQAGKLYHHLEALKQKFEICRSLFSAKKREQSIHVE